MLCYQISYSGLRHWLQIVISNAKALILGTYHDLPKASLQSYLDEFCIHFSHHSFGGALLQHLVLAISALFRLAQKDKLIVKFFDSPEFENLEPEIR